MPNNDKESKRFVDDDLSTNSYNKTSLTSSPNFNDDDNDQYDSFNNVQSYTNPHNSVQEEDEYNAFNCEFSR